MMAARCRSARPLVIWRRSHKECCNSEYDKTQRNASVGLSSFDAERNGGFSILLSPSGSPLGHGPPVTTTRANGPFGSGAALGTGYQVYDLHH